MRVSFLRTLFSSMTTNGSLNSNEVADEYDRSVICIGDGADGFSWPTWLAQANHVFDSLDISSNFVDYSELLPVHPVTIFDNRFPQSL